MGSTVSSLNNLKQNPHLLKLVANQHVSHTDDKFWKELLSFAFNNPPSNAEEAKLLEESIHPLLYSLMENNLSSRNVGSIAKVFIHLTAILKTDQDKNKDYNYNVWQAFNSLYLLKCVTKFLVETLTEDNLLRHFVAVNDSDEKKEEPGIVMIESVLNSLIEILVDVPLSDLTYNIHVEAINTLLIILSLQMYSARFATKSSIYHCIMQKKCAIHALLLTKNLLNNFINQKPAPKNMHGGSLILGLASGIWSALTLGYGKGDGEVNEAILARQSLLLLLVLTNHCTSETNPYRDALFSCCDSQIESNINTDQVKGFKIEFSKLYDTLCVTLNDDQTTLLLYLLLHRNQHFKSFVLSRSADLHLIVLPILKILYSSPERNSHHIYMALIILLVLSEDNLFNEYVHDIMLKNITWFSDRNLPEISLGGLIVLVIIRTIQFNISRTRDRFLHTNLCATLANMSNYFKGLNPYVCQRLISLFEKLSKRLNKALAGLPKNQQNGIEQTDASSDAEGSIISTISSTVSPELINDLSIYEEVLKMILEIINACLTAQLTHNPNLVYTLLYKRHVFESFHNHPSFQEIVMNIETVLTYFSNRIEALDKNLSVSEVYQIIQQSSLQWPSDRLRKFPELRFRYVEDDQPEEFFIPYIWSLVYRSSEIYWNSQNILLFNPHRSATTY